MKKRVWKKWRARMLYHQRKALRALYSHQHRRVVEAQHDAMLRYASKADAVYRWDARTCRA